VHKLLLTYSTKYCQNSLRLIQHQWQSTNSNQPYVMHTYGAYRFQRILPPKMPLFVRQKVQILSKILPRIPNFTSFSPFENDALSAVHNCNCCQLIPWSTAKTVRGFWLLLFSKKKTGDCWISGILNSCSFCLESQWQIINHYILECHMVKLMA